MILSEAKPQGMKRRAVPWSRYRARYRQRKVELTGFPGGCVGRVGVVERNRTIILRWRQDKRQHWEPVGKASEGDVMSRAVARASEINRDLASCSASASAFQPATVKEACDLYLAAKEASPNVCGATISKYASELAKIVEYAGETAAGRRRRFIHQLDTHWCEEFALWLDSLRATRNGGPVTPDNPDQPLSQALKRETKRLLWSVIEHAILRNPPLAPPAFRNPMMPGLVGSATRCGNGVSDPPVTHEELAAIAAGLDAYALGVLAPLFLYGPRPSELGHILRSDYDDSNAFLHMVSRSATGYQTKGKRGKAWPVTSVLAACLRPFLARTAGPLFVKRWIFENRAQPAILDATEGVLAGEFERRIMIETTGSGKRPDKERLEQISEVVWAAAGAVDARDIARELARAAGKAGLRRIPTPKDTRHLMETDCEAARLSPGVIRYLLGHAPGRGDVLVCYNHTGRAVLREQMAIVDERRRVLVEALGKRAAELSGRDLRCAGKGIARALAGVDDTARRNGGES
ncbi:MAG TPA: hypothetical protein PK280_20985 [Planctomycetota bacterium]|nr:hypothetical protein [Planctomycetota bacterium]